MIELFHGDCREVLKTIPDKKFNLAVTSPPYNMNLRISKGRHVSRQVVKEISTKYEGFSDNLPLDELLEFNIEVINQLLRVSELVFYNIQILTGNKKSFLKLMGIFSDNIKEIIVWDKVNSQPAICQNVLNSRFELILVMQDANAAVSRKFSKSDFKGTIDNLWQIKRGKKHNKDHGASFPEELVERIILNFSKEGDEILDPFMGTGTSGAVSVRNGRKFSGIELVKKYYDFSESRIGAELL